jgi:hypothetical protein
MEVRADWESASEASVEEAGAAEAPTKARSETVPDVNSAMPV